ncbi:hypothetical protein FQ186_21910 [Pseudomonas sp. ANT_H14]|nr:hypothetical protein FQ182_25155 [Pseudomonas sp. ANT_H4]KAA0949891.1 hypothetical protein FQ186_21910 [Pseudomonas sp. ANT_H14]
MPSWLTGRLRSRSRSKARRPGSRPEWRKAKTDLLPLVNNDTGILNHLGALRFFASKLAHRKAERT